MRFYLWALGLTLLGCQNYSDNSLATDQIINTKCPANGCANTLASSNEMNISWSGSSPVILSANDLSVQLGGNCYPSTYPDNHVDVLIYKANAAVSASVLAPVYANTATVRCTNGRFNAVIDAQSLPGAGLYNVRMELVAVDAAGNQIRGGSNVAQVDFVR